MGQSRKLTAELRRGSGSLRDALDALKHGGTARSRRGEALNPLHGVDVTVQNVSSVFAERVNALPEFDAYYRVALDAEETYMPDGPPMSPLTGSYFTTWAFYDLRFGPDDETIGTCLFDLADRLGMGPDETEAIRLMSEARMGVYEHAGLRGGRCLLRELITDDEFECYCPAGYLGSQGELGFVQLCPPIDPASYHVPFTTPYILMGFGKANWTAYLSKSLIGLTAPEKRRRLHEVLKYGREPNVWSEFILKAYLNHRHGVIFLTGLPDVPGSMPQA